MWPPNFIRNKTFVDTNFIYLGRVLSIYLGSVSCASSGQCPSITSESSSTARTPTYLRVLSSTSPPLLICPVVSDQLSDPEFCTGSGGFQIPLASTWDFRVKRKTRVWKRVSTGNTYPG